MTQHLHLHLTPNNLGTPTTMKDRIFYFSNFNLKALLSLSEQLRSRQSTCDVAKMSKCGSLHVNRAIFVTFDDGIERVFRSPMAGRNHFYSVETSSKIVESEASTLMYLKFTLRSRFLRSTRTSNYRECHPWWNQVLAIVLVEPARAASACHIFFREKLQAILWDRTIGLNVQIVSPAVGILAQCCPFLTKFKKKSWASLVPS